MPFRNYSLIELKGAFENENLYAQLDAPRTH
jgi:hypothetical protein